MIQHAILSAGPRALAAATLVVAVCLASPPASGEEVDHPMYLSWAGKPVGTSVTLRTLTEAKGHVLTTTNQTTLKELKADVAILETRRVSDATGTKQAKAPETYRQPRKFPLFPGVKKEDVGRPMGAIEQGEESITLAGREFRAVWFETKTKGDGGHDWYTRTWMADDVPGRLLRSVTRIPDAGTTITTELVEFRTP